MSFALFANVENSFDNPARALAETTVTVELAEALGFEEAWITEHHFNRFSISASIFPLLGWLAGRTRRIRLGSAAVLLPFHHPIRVAEDAASLDTLSGGRLMLGVARGGPFPQQFRHFGIGEEDSRNRTLEALCVVDRLLHEENVSHLGRWYWTDQVTVQPRPLQHPVPIWLASLAEDSIDLAASRGFGLMGASAAPVGSLLPALRRYTGRCTAPGRPFVLARYFLCNENHQHACDEAAAFIQAFPARMGAQDRHPQQGRNTPSPVANALVGDPAAILGQIRTLQAQLDTPHTLLLKPATDNPDTARHALKLFAEKIRPLL
jgi:alkanesulfonate monooxygenase SsuD/methylene tetrahydromethanopterin reductase-like flavin-dependent oxidoreductase (luciferase family)